MADGPTDSVKSATLFLSYARADEPFARKLATALEQAGFTIWWDAMIEGGAAFGRSIAEALERADAVLVLWSKTSIDSDWVKDEAAQGRDRHRLIPLAIDGTPPPLGFRQYQTIDLSHWNGRRTAPQFASLERAVAAALGQKPAAQLARELGIARNQLYKWKEQLQAKGEAKAFRGPGGPASADLSEIERLRRELKRVTEERDILKKAAAYFAKELP